jgi:hypothetical protein
MNDILETIEAYLDGSLPAEERKLFEEKLKTDPGLAETFRLYQGIQSTMHKAPPAKGEDQLQQSMHQLRKKHASAHKPAKRVLFREWRAVAAVFVIVVGAGLWWLLQRPDADGLYKKYATHAQIEIGARGSANDRLALSAARAYNAGNYARSADLLKRYNAREPGVAEMQLAEGVSYLELDRFAEAEPLFDSIARGQTVFAGHARWYLGLMYLKQGKLDESKKVLQSIPEDAATYERAQSLLKEL